MILFIFCACIITHFVSKMECVLYIPSFLVLQNWPERSAYLYSKQYRGIVFLLFCELCRVFSLGWVDPVYAKQPTWSDSDCVSFYSLSLFSISPLLLSFFPELGLFFHCFFLICPDVDRFDVVAVTKMVTWLKRRCQLLWRHKSLHVGNSFPPGSRLLWENTLCSTTHATNPIHEPWGRVSQWPLHAVQEKARKIMSLCWHTWSDTFFHLQPLRQIDQRLIR